MLLSLYISLTYRTHHTPAADESEGVRGLKALGVRDLNYRTAFLASTVQPATGSGSGSGGELRAEQLTADAIKHQMTEAEWSRVYEMSRDRNLYQNITTSLFPTIHGNDEIKRGECCPGGGG